MKSEELFTLHSSVLRRAMKSASINFMRHVILTPVENGWMAEVPSLPGCITEADTREEALEYIREAIEAYILTLQDHGEPIPDDIEVELAMV